MQTHDIRRKFLKYFEGKKHTIVPSSPVIPHDDPTLLFINAGMNQFKDVFLGKSVRDYTRATTSQKCIRVGGKHNDLENVGHTARHLTFFEMMGNFSFGDYFKQEAIAFAWEVTCEIFEFDAEKVWVSVFREDDEAYELWTKYLPESRIVRLDERDNFWAMGETGPCGPCSELLYDRGEKYGSAPSPYEDTDGNRYAEFWNLVFMQYNRDGSGTMTPLPKPSIDTGMGLERLIAFKTGVDTVFETDVLRALITEVEKISGQRYEPKQWHAAAPFRVIADHMRSLSFSIADGVQPSNVDRGYVLRKVLRRAVRYGRQLGIDKPFLGQLLPVLLGKMGDDFVELGQAKGRIEEILALEEEAFLRTLRRGGNLLAQVVETAQQGKKQICGDDAFKLKDTYGLPLDEILLLAKDAELTVDLDRYQALEQEARERSKAVHKVVRQEAEESIFVDFVEKEGETAFIGYAGVEGAGTVKGLIHDGKWVDHLSSGKEGMVVLDKTPFYAEKGGQIGDTGHLSKEGGRFEVQDTQSPYTGVTVHIGKVEEGELRVGDQLTGIVEGGRRQRIADNHTATHLLHWALSEVLGGHVKQAGSVVAPDRLRFDFSHHKGLTNEEIRGIEDLVNGAICRNAPVQTEEIAYAEAQKRPEIKQFFGDKYGATVRVVDVGVSQELCGGTHTDQTGNLGYFRIVKEGSVAAGVRRIEAVTGAEAVAFARSPEDLIEEVAHLLGTKPQKLLDRASKLLEENTHYAREMKAAKKQEMERIAHGLVAKAETTDEVTMVISEVKAEPGELRQIAEGAMAELKSGVLLLGAKGGDKCALFAAVSGDWTAKGVHAGKLIKELAPLVGGGGGGKADMAQAGGKEPDKLSYALSEGKRAILEQC